MIPNMQTLGHGLNLRAGLGVSYAPVRAVPPSNAYGRLAFDPRTFRPGLGENGDVSSKAAAIAEAQQRFFAQLDAGAIEIPDEIYDDPAKVELALKQLGKQHADMTRNVQALHVALSTIEDAARSNPMIAAGLAEAGYTADEYMEARYGDVIAFADKAWDFSLAIKEAMWPWSNYTNEELDTVLKRHGFGIGIVATIALISIIIAVGAAGTPFLYALATAGDAVIGTGDLAKANLLETATRAADDFETRARAAGMPEGEIAAGRKEIMSLAAVPTGAGTGFWGLSLFSGLLVIGTLAVVWGGPALTALGKKASKARIRFDGGGGGDGGSRDAYDTPDPEPTRRPYSSGGGSSYATPRPGSHSDPYS